MDKPAIQVCEAFAKAGYPLEVEALLIVEVEGSDEEIADLLGRHHRHRQAVRAQGDAHQPERRAERRHLEGPQGGVRRHRPHLRLLLHGRRHPARQAGRGAGRHLAHLRQARPAGRQHLPRRRRQPAPAGPLRRQRCRRRPSGPSRRAHEILELCVASGGCLTGEHGVGIEKRDLMRVQFTETDLPLQMRIKTVFDPKWLLNPAKVFPLEGRERGAGSRVRRADRCSPTCARSTSGSSRACSPRRRRRTTPLAVVGGGSKQQIGRPMQTAASVSTKGLRGITLYEPSEMVMSARAGTPLAQIEDALAARGQMLAFEPIELGRARRRRGGRRPPSAASSPPTCRARGASASARRATTCSGVRGGQRARRDLQVRRPRDEERHRLRPLPRPVGQLGHAGGHERGDVQGAAACRRTPAR